MAYSKLQYITKGKRMTQLSIIPSRDEMDTIQTIAKAAWDSKHFEKLGGLPGLITIALYCRELGVPIMTGLYGGMQNIQGKITMSAELMNNMIRQKGHKMEIRVSDVLRCTIHGTRKDTGESYEATFSMQDAERAGLTKNQTWSKYPSQMLFARCISLLAKRLFPDVISGAYVEGELDEIANETEKKEAKKIVTLDASPSTDSATIGITNVTTIPAPVEQVYFITPEDCEKIEAMICPDDKVGEVSYRSSLLGFFKNKHKLEKCEAFTDVPEKSLKAIFNSIHKRNAVLLQKVDEEALANG